MRVTLPPRPDLPIAEHWETIREAIRTEPVVVVCGETGSGKSTQLPLIALDAGRGDRGRIAHTQPRRIAARSIAARVAQELRTELGGVVGYKVRFGDRTGPGTLVKVMTDGMLLAETARDRGLRAYDTIIVDEAHERSLNVDFLLGYLHRLLRQRDGLRVVITSATIDPERFARHFARGGRDAPIVEVSGRSYPIEVEYRPLTGLEDAPDLRLEQGVAESAIDLLDRCGGDVLAFLPGEREIRETARVLRGRLRARPQQAVEILPLYARLSTAEQDRVFAPHPGRRIVLATNVAETSLTVPSVRGVVDGGLARLSRYSPRSKVQHLPVEAVSQASARQRSGRCGRIGPGICVRLYAEDDFASRDAFTSPEILRTNLASVILQMEALRLGEVASFPFLEPPTRAMVRDGYDTLRELGAIDDDVRLTKLGRRLAALPVDPRVGRMILAASEEGCLDEMLVIAAALSVQDPRDRPHDRADAADQAHRAFADETSDFLGYLNLWRAIAHEKETSSWNRLRDWCGRNFVSFVRYREWRDVHRQLLLLARELGLRLSDAPAPADAIHRALLCGLLSNVARLDERRTYEGTRGSTCYIFPGSSQFKRTPKWIVAAEVVETTKRYARCVARVQPEWIERAGAHLLKRSHSDPWWDPKRGAVFCHERVTLLGLELAAARRVPFGPVDPAAAREMFIHHALIENEWSLRYPFVERNRALEEEVRAIEAKRRRRDVMVEIEARYAYFDARVPRDVHSAKAFDRWYRQASRRDHDVLCMERSDLVRADAGGFDAAAFPDALEIAGAHLDLEYHLDPGADADGVTIIVPAPMLAALSDERLGWLVPGLLPEKIEALVRGLPKSVRRCFSPVPESARAVAERLAFGEGRCEDALARALGAFGGVNLSARDLAVEDLPPHLHMSVRMVDERGATLAESRDIGRLRREHAGTVRDVLARTPDGQTRTGATMWDFGELPESIQFRRGDIAMTAWPGLVDEGRTVGCRPWPTREEADRAHRRGLRRLYALACADELRFQCERLPDVGRIRLLHAPWGAQMPFDDTVRVLVSEQCFVFDPAPRDEAAFRARLDERWNDLWDVGCRVIAVLGAILDTHQAAQIALDAADRPAFAPAVADARAHVAALTTPGFLVTVPWSWLEQYPRYLRAVSRRLERLRTGGVQRDAQSAHQLAIWGARWQQRVEAEQRAGRPIGEMLRAARWMLEEYRVSLFAPELGTAVRVSPKRLGEVMG